MSGMYVERERGCTISQLFFFLWSLLDLKCRSVKFGGAQLYTSKVCDGATIEIPSTPLLTVQGSTKAQDDHRPISKAALGKSQTGTDQTELFLVSGSCEKVKVHATGKYINILCAPSHTLIWLFCVWYIVQGHRHGKDSLHLDLSWSTLVHHNNRQSSYICIS
jgi:hypothetical protein